MNIFFLAFNPSQKATGLAVMGRSTGRQSSVGEILSDWLRGPDCFGMIALQSLAALRGWNWCLWRRKGGSSLGVEVARCPLPTALLQASVVRPDLLGCWPPSSRCSNTSGWEESSASPHKPFQPSAMAGITVRCISVFQGQPSTQGATHSPILPSSGENTRRTQHEPQSCRAAAKNLLPIRWSKQDSRSMAEMVIKAGLGLTCQATNWLDNQDPAITAYWLLAWPLWVSWALQALQADRVSRRGRAVALWPGMKMILHTPLVFCYLCCSCWLQRPPVSSLNYLPGGQAVVTVDFLHPFTFRWQVWSFCRQSSAFGNRVFLLSVIGGLGWFYQIPQITFLLSIWSKM